MWKKGSQHRFNWIYKGKQREAEGSRGKQEGAKEVKGSAEGHSEYISKSVFS